MEKAQKICAGIYYFEKLPDNPHLVKLKQDIIAICRRWLSKNSSS
jgi:hypothetical protein